MQTKTETKPSLTNLVYLPAFARYLLTHKLDEMAEVQVRISEEVNVPMLRFFKDFTAAERLRITRQGLTDLLAALAENKAQEHIDQSMRQWQENQLPILGKEDVVAEDITLISYVRKKSFLYFIPDFSLDTESMLELIREIDFFLVTNETTATNLYISLLKERIDTHSHFIEKITNTSPGIIYVYDVLQNKELYANRATSDFLGYSLDEIRDMGNQMIDLLMHPDDLPVLRQYESEFNTVQDGEVRSFKYRMRNASGDYRWLRTYETVFRRTPDGRVSEKIGIAIDVHDQKIMADALRKREQELLEAQEIAQLGSYVWDFTNQNSQGSPQTVKILEVGINDYDAFMNRVHPEDLERVKKAIETSMKTGTFNCEYRYQGNQQEKIIWSRGRVIFEDGKPVCMNGTLMDVTERQTLVRELQSKDLLYRQAEELAGIGNWTWNMLTNDIQWSDQQYRIYDLEPQSEPITMEKFLQFLHPDDREKINDVTAVILEKGYSDHSFRILTRNDQTRTVHSLARLYRNEQGQPLYCIGVEQDITERQVLINNLKKNEELYKQAQALAHVGNYTLDLDTGKLHWSDELYRIFGLEPQAEIINYERYLAFIHPDDREPSLEIINEAIRSGDSKTNVHRIVRDDGTERYIQSTGEVITQPDGKRMMLGTAQDVTEKQTLIERLQKSEHLYKQAQTLAGMGNWSWDVESGKVEWSDELYHIYELQPTEQMSYERVKSFVHPEDREGVILHMQQCLQTGETYDRHHRIVLPGGTTKIIHRRAEVVMEGGKGVRMIGTTQDVTETFRVQQELKDNQTFIRKIADATPSIIASYNINSGKYVFISEGLTKLLGYSIPEVMNKGAEFFMDIIHPDDRMFIFEKNAKALEEVNQHPERSDTIIEFTYRMRNSAGEYRWFHTYGTIFDRNADGKVEHVLNISLDVTEQKEATLKIAEQEHFIQQIADASPTILYLYDVDTQRMVYINREIFFVLGYLPDEIIELDGDVTELLYHPDDYQHLPARKQSSKTFQQVDSMIQYECRLRNKDHEWRWFLVREIVFKTDERGQIKQILGAALDINRRKEMERTILQNSMLLEQSNASLEEFAYVASHDLKEPLRKISTFGDRLVASHGDNLTPEGKIYLKKIVDASQRMQTMISDLLSISMISGNKAFEPYSLQKIMDETIQTLEYKIEQQNAVIHYSGLPVVHMVPSQFRQLFQNLLSNSLKFVRDGVQPLITIECSQITTDELPPVQVAQAERYYHLVFTDNGIGFENEFAGKIFTIFHRLHGRSEYEGSGIGLAICKKIVEHHGGVIYAKGAPGAGATFTIILPE